MCCVVVYKVVFVCQTMCNMIVLVVDAVSWLSMVSPLCVWCMCLLITYLMSVCVCVVCVYVCVCVCDLCVYVCVCSDHVCV